MGLDRANVVEALNDPEVSWPGIDGRRIAARQEIAVVFDPSDLHVVTVLWHTPDEWGRESAGCSPVSTEFASA